MPRMENIASILKTEIARVARKEVRAETLGLKMAVGAYRSEIAALTRIAAGAVTFTTPLGAR